MRPFFATLALAWLMTLQLSACAPVERPGLPPLATADDTDASSVIPEATPSAPQETAPQETAPQETVPQETAKASGAAAADPAPTPVATQPPVDLNQIASGLTADCQKRLTRIRVLAKAVPRIFLDLKRKPDEIDRDVIECTALCREYLKDCAGAPLDLEVKGTLARMLLGRYDRVRYGLKAEKLPRKEMNAVLAEYRAEIRALATATVNAAALPPFVRADSLRVLIEMSERERDFETLRQHAADLVRRYPDFDLIANSVYAHGRSFLSQGRYADAFSFIETVLETRSDEEALAIYNIILFEAMTGIGDLEGMEDLMESILIEYPERAPLAKKPYLRKQYAQWIHVAEFWIGFCRYARGDISGARDAFESHRARVESLAARLAEKNQKLDPVVGIFLEMRTRDLLTVLENFQGNSPVVDMNFEDSWLTEERFTLAEARGDVVIVMFRQPGDSRSQRYYEEVGRLLDQYQDQGLRAVTVSYVMGTPNPERDAEKARRVLEEMEHLEIRMPAAFDPDRKRQSFFKALHGTIGPSASCVLIDRNGAIAWFKADPRDMDKQILRRVVERLLAGG